MVLGTPDRYSSARPLRRLSTKRWRHLPTVGLEHLSSAATISFVFPSAQANTIFDLSARACGLFGRRAQRERVSRSSSDSTRGTFGRPRSAMRTSIVAHENVRRGSKIPDYPIYLTNLGIRRLEGAHRSLGRAVQGSLGRCQLRIVAPVHEISRCDRAVSEDRSHSRVVVVEDETFDVR